ncbi:MAG TPA: CUB domain-containing protein, partial [Cytophagales bacterium]|nr:CUB domain-containing protein [Cytophagales bacterium]
SMDTEANMDYIWLFDGTQTIPEYLIAKFSGHKSPPLVISRTHQVLIWFVSNETTTGQGWTLNYSAVE